MIGVCYLYVKTIERAHLPSKLWEKIKLNASYSTALEQIEEELAYWPNFIVHKCKQRLTKLRQMLKRMRKIKLKVKEKLTTIKKKTERRDKIRELKAEKVARIENQIEAELLQRRKQGVYGELYEEVPEKEEEKEAEKEIEYEAEDEKEMEDIEDIE
jgi:protein MAK16